MLVKGSFATILSAGVRSLFLGGRLLPEWEQCGFSSEEDYKKAVEEARLERAADPESYDRLTEGMMPRIPK